METAWNRVGSSAPIAHTRNSESRAARDSTDTSYRPHHRRGQEPSQTGMEEPRLCPPPMNGQWVNHWDDPRAQLGRYAHGAA